MHIAQAEKESKHTQGIETHMWFSGIRVILEEGDTRARD